MTSLKTSIKTITYLSDIGCLEIQGASLFVTILLFIAIIAVVIWLFLIIYVYFCELFRSHWIAVWFILWSVVINLTIGFGIYDKLAPVISLMK